VVDQQLLALKISHSLRKFNQFLMVAPAVSQSGDHLALEIDELRLILLEGRYILDELQG